MSFTEIYTHRLKYFLSPQLDLYKNIREFLTKRKAGTEGKLGFNEWQKRQRISVLDYGCGNGVGSVTLLSDFLHVDGVDNDQESVNLCRDLFGHLIAFDNQDLSLECLSENQEPLYDVIVCVEVIEHIEGVELLLRNFSRILDKDGVLVLSTLNHNSQYRKNKGHVGRYCVEDFKKMVGSVFQNIRISDYTLEGSLDDASTVTPMVAICEGKTSER